MQAHPNYRASVRAACSSGAPAPDLFVIRRSQTTEGETHIVTMELAGDRPPHYEKTPLTVGRGPSHATRACERVSLAIARALQRSRGTGPRATGKSRPGGRANGEDVETGRSLLPGHRSRRDREVSPTWKMSRPGGSTNGFMKHPRITTETDL